MVQASKAPGGELSGTVLKFALESVCSLGVGPGVPLHSVATAWLISISLR